MKIVVNSYGTAMKIAGFVLCWIGLASCGGSFDKAKIPEPNEKMYVVDFDHVGKTERILYSTLFDSQKTIILDTTQESLIGTIDKLDVYKDALFVLDWTQAKVLCMFDLDGNFIRRFGNIGPGPGEYIDLADFTIDPDNGIIYLLENRRRRINAYDIESGNFIRSIDIKRDKNVLSRHIQYIGGSLFSDAYFSAPSPKNYLLQKIDLSTGEQVEAFLNVDEYNKGWNDLGIIDEPVFHRLNDSTVLFTHQFMDQVMMLDGQTVMPYLELRGKNMMRAKDVRNINQDQDYFQISQELRRLNGIYNIRSCIEHGDSIFVKCQRGGDFLSVLFDVKTGKAKYIYPKNDLLFVPENGGCLLPSFGCATPEGQFYFMAPVAMADFKNSIEKGLLQPDVDQLDRLKALDDNANPVIFFYKYK